MMYLYIMDTSALRLKDIRVCHGCQLLPCHPVNQHSNKARDQLTPPSHSTSYSLVPCPQCLVATTDHLPPYLTFQISTCCNSTCWQIWLFGRQHSIVDLMRFDLTLYTRLQWYMMKEALPSTSAKTPKPVCIQGYTINTPGVDLPDQMIKPYQVMLKSRTWY